MPGPANDLNINQAGYVVFDGTATFFGRTFQAGTGISLSNPNGIAGNTTITATGGGSNINAINLQTGTSPIGPTAGAITFNGAVVSAGTHPVRTDGTGANTMALEVQISQAIAATDATKIGLSNFDSGAFTVDSNGFVQLKGGGAATTSLTGNSGTATPDGSGNINVVTANSTPKFVGASNTLTLDFNLGNLVLGSSLPSITSGTRNAGVGAGVLASTTSATDNTAVGYVALGSTTTGDNCCAFGSGAAAANTSGTQNNAFGKNALLANSSGSFNSAFGFGTLGNCNSSNNTAMGHESSVNVTSGVNNTSFGFESLFSATTGSQNTGIGYSALVLSLGSYNTALGFNSGSTYTSTESSNILIANNGTTADNNTIRIGTQGSGSGQQNLCFVAGITGVTTSNSQMVTINTSTGQLGAAAIPASTVWSETSGTFVSSAGHGYFITNTASTTLPASPTEGDTIRFSVDTTNILTINANTGQTIRLNTSVTASAGNAVNVAQGAAIELVYKSTGTVWMAVSANGSWTLT